jgi:hypothetical protein
MSSPVPSWPRLLCAGVLALTSLLAHAQYSWLDDKGMRVFSDRPPPPGTPAERVLKTPHGLEPRAVQPEATPAPAAGGSAEAAKTATLADKELEFRKRTQQREAEEKKAAQDASSTAAKLENCAVARDSERAVNSGMRMSRLNEKGEKVFLTDEERAQRLEGARKILKSCP